VPSPYGRADLLDQRAQIVGSSEKFELTRSQAFEKSRTALDRRRQRLAGHAKRVDVLALLLVEAGVVEQPADPD